MENDLREAYKCQKCDKGIYFEKTLTCSDCNNVISIEDQKLIKEKLYEIRYLQWDKFNIHDMEISFDKHKETI